MSFVTSVRPRRNLVRSISNLAIGFCRTRFTATSNSKPHFNHGFASASLIPKFAPERAAEIAIFAIQALLWAERKW